MSQNDNDELNELLATNIAKAKNPSPTQAKWIKYADDTHDNGASKLDGHLVQWTSPDGKRFIPASHTREILVPGFYDIQHSNQIGIYFEKIPVKTEGLLRFPQTNSEKIIQEIQKFWDREHYFRQYQLSYKRGIMLWGVPGGGKSCTIQMIMSDVIDRKGVVIRFGTPHLFSEGVRIFREIQNDTPIVALMEDIDSTIERYNESEVLNILDGVDQIEKICFLATTNYPEKLGARILNRPSRFDKRFKIDFPNKQSRKIYFEHLMKPETIEEFKIDIDKWVEDTKKFSIAHLKELFIAVVILGDNYDDALKTLKSMKEDISSEKDVGKSMGFLSNSDGESD